MHHVELQGGEMLLVFQRDLLSRFEAKNLGGEDGIMLEM